MVKPGVKVPVSGPTFVIPVYNGMPFLPEAVESVLAQTDRIWNLVLVDDGSHDGSQSYIKSLADPRVRTFFNESNLGLYGSLMRTVSSIHSEWIAVLMQDDRLKPCYLHEMERLRSTYPGAAAFWATEDIIGPDGALITRANSTRREEIILPGTAPWLSVLRRGCIWTISGSFTKRDVFIAEPFRADLPHCGDYDWLLRAIRRWPFVYYQFALAELRQHEGQASARNLAAGTDIREHHSILRRNYYRHANDLPVKVAFEVSFHRFRLTMRRLVSAIIHGRLGKAMLLAKYALKFLWLPYARLYSS